DYSAGLTFGRTTLTNVESISLDNGYSYDLTLNNATVTVGQTLTVNASSLGAGDTLTFAGGTSSGNLVIFGSTGGHDILTGNHGDTVFVGDGASDTISLVDGANDIVAFDQASDSTSTGFDTVEYFNTAKDQFSVFSEVTNIDATYVGGTLDASNFDADLTADLAKKLTADGAIVYEAKTGSYAGVAFLVIDQNGQAGYQAGQDLVIEFQHRTGGSLTTANFLLDYTPPVPETAGKGHDTHGAHGTTHAVALPDGFDWDSIFANRPSPRQHIASPVMAAGGHQGGIASQHEGLGDAHWIGHHDAGYHSQLEALSGHHIGLTDQFALPHAEYFGS
ncbi:MAG: hypothetical protein ACREHV_16865, partial [Rhizomicrobium sp.]